MGTCRGFLLTCFTSILYILVKSYFACQYCSVLEEESPFSWNGVQTMFNRKWYTTRRIFFLFVSIFLIILLVGCERIGYMVTINTNCIKYDDLKQIAEVLKDKGFKMAEWERKKEIVKYPGEVYTLFEKRVTENPLNMVYVFLNYIKDIPNNNVCRIKIEIHNIYQGMTITELRDEIDKIGDLVHHELVNKLGKENVQIERKEIHHRVIFF